MRIKLGVVYTLLDPNKLNNGTDLASSRNLAEQTAKHIVSKNPELYKDLDLSTLQVDPYGYSAELKAMEYIYTARKMGWEEEIKKKNGLE